VVAALPRGTPRGDDRGGGAGGVLSRGLPGGSFQQAVQTLRAMAEAATRRRRESGVA